MNSGDSAGANMMIVKDVMGVNVLRYSYSAYIKHFCGNKIYIK